MGYLLKIVDGPNKGAEIALPEGVAVTVGKGDECDVVLADMTLPDDPLTLRSEADGVTLDGSALDQFAVVTRGGTSFAVGPADAPWGELRRPEAKTEGQETSDERREDDGASRDSSSSSPSSPESPASAEPPSADDAPAEKKRRGGCLGCLVALLLLLAALAAAAWLFRDKVRPRAEAVWTRVGNQVSEFRCGSDAEPEAKVTLADIAAKFGVAMTNRADRTVLAGNFRTRAERLVATAEAYAAQPGVDLDFSDDESLRTAAEDTLALLAEKDLSVAAATNRVVALSGRARHLRRTLEALAADMSKLDGVDVSGVRSPEVPKPGSLDEEEEAAGPESSAAAARLSRPRNIQPSKLPVCGILTTPYPCLVLRSGARVTEGAPFGEWIVEKIEADAVTVTNSTGRVVWKP